MSRFSKLIYMSWLNVKFSTKENVEFVKGYKVLFGLGFQSSFSSDSSHPKSYCELLENYFKALTQSLHETYIFSNWKHYVRMLVKNIRKILYQTSVGIIIIHCYVSSPQEGFHTIQCSLIQICSHIDFSMIETFNLATWLPNSSFPGVNFPLSVETKFWFNQHLTHTGNSWKLIQNFPKI